MAAAPAPAAEAAPKGGGSKKLIIIIVALLALVVVGGGAAAVLLMKKSTHAEAGEGEEEHDAPAEKAKPKEHKAADGKPPTFVPLDPFTVNLADKDADRYAQVGINLQVEDPKMADEIKNYMPAIRNGILLILSHKNSEDLLSTEGKQKLAEEIRRETARSMGYEVPDPDEDEGEGDEDAPKKKKKKKKAAEPYNPIVHVHYSNFIVQ
jgi:flagellar FliL protein